MEPPWQKSSFSEDSDGNCVELAIVDGNVLIRESDDPGTVMKIAPEQLHRLISHARSNRRRTR